MLQLLLPARMPRRECDECAGTNESQVPLGGRAERVFERSKPLVRQSQEQRALPGTRLLLVVLVAIIEVVQVLLQLELVCAALQLGAAHMLSLQLCAHRRALVVRGTNDVVQLVTDLGDGASGLRCLVQLLEQLLHHTHEVRVGSRYAITAEVHCAAAARRTVFRSSSNACLSRSASSASR